MIKMNAIARLTGSAGILSNSVFTFCITFSYKKGFLLAMPQAIG
jgi:hypothetical protein